MNDTFDPSQFKLDTLVDPMLVTEALLTHIPVQRPNRQQFIRTHPDPEYQYDAAALTYDGETYLVATSMLSALEGEYRAVRLQLAIPRDGGAPFLWPLNLPLEEGRQNPWNVSAMKAAHEAQSAWVRVMSDKTLGMYITRKAEGIKDEPQWPEQSMNELLGIAFEEKVITQVEHPVVRKLMGDA